MSKNEKKPLGPNSVDMGERGTYDKRNKLNDLTGKEFRSLQCDLCCTKESI